MGKTARREIEHALCRMVRSADASAPFVLDSFEESLDKRVTAAKHEVDAYIRQHPAQVGATPVQLLSMGDD